MSIDKLKTKFFTGAWLTDVKHYFTKINEIIDYLNNLPSSSLPYESYQALLTQSGITFDNTNIIELYNSTGGTITFSYINVGVYGISLNGMYVTGKVGLFIEPSGNSNDFTTSSTITTQYNGFDGYILRTFVDPTTLSNGGLTNTLLEIRVYN